MNPKISDFDMAWRLWNDDKITSLTNPEISDPIFYKDIFECIHVGLLCVQELARDRPTMATVISILNSEIVNLPCPRQPAFVVRQAMLIALMSNKRSEELHSINDVTITDLLGRQQSGHEVVLKYIFMVLTQSQYLNKIYALLYKCFKVYSEF